MIGYIVALLPLYMFLYLPISHMLYGTSEKAGNQQITNFNSSFIATNDPLSCPFHNYNTFILSHEPLIIYIENFLSPDESQHLLEIRYTLTDISISNVDSGIRII
jgi:prolyl 4-hydroxylase